MRRMKPTTKRKVAAVIAVVLVIALVLSVFAPFLSFIVRAEEAGTGFAIEAQLGFDGNVKIEKDVPVSIKVTNNTGKKFKGTVSIQTSSADIMDLVQSSDIDDEFSSDSDTITYYSDTELAPGDTKIINGSIPASTIENYYAVVISDSKGNVKQRQDFNIVTDRTESVWMGIMSDSTRTKDEISKNYTIYAGKFGLDRLVDVKKENLDALDNINLLVINDFDINNLSPEDKDRICSWLQNGGVNDIVDIS